MACLHRLQQTDLKRIDQPTVRMMFPGSSGRGFERLEKPEGRIAVICYVGNEQRSKTTSVVTESFYCLYLFIFEKVAWTRERRVHVCCKQI